MRIGPILKHPHGYFAAERAHSASFHPSFMAAIFVCSDRSCQGLRNTGTGLSEFQDLPSNPRTLAACWAAGPNFIHCVSNRDGRTTMVRMRAATAGWLSITFSGLMSQYLPLTLFLSNKRSCTTMACFHRCSFGSSRR